MQNNSLLHMRANEGDVQNYLFHMIPPHWHHELEFFSLVSGKVRFFIEDASFDLEDGEGCFVNSDVLHSIKPAINEPCRFQSFVFSPEFITGSPESVFDTRYVQPIIKSHIKHLVFCKGTGDDSFFSDFASAMAACRNESNGYEFVVRSALSSIIMHILRRLEKDSVHYSPSAERDERLREMLLWISSTNNWSITTREIAASANVSARACQRLFHNYMHCTPMQYVMGQRLTKASQLLLTSDMAITEIAMELGFSNPSHFTREFHKTTGFTPREYRNRYLIV